MEIAIESCLNAESKEERKAEDEEESIDSSWVLSLLDLLTTIASVFTGSEFSKLMSPKFLNLDINKNHFWKFIGLINVFINT